MRSGPPNNRRPRSRHHNGGHNGGGHSGGGHAGGGGNHGSNGGGHVSNGGNRPRSAASLRHQTFDSNSGDVRVRGNAWQVHEKYQALARDAQSSGDRVAAENYQQHAEHYYRIIEAINEATAAETRTRDTYSQQPETPPSYYADGNGPQPGLPGAIDVTNGNVQPQQSGVAMADGATTSRASSPFFTTDEVEDNAGPMAVNQ